MSTAPSSTPWRRAAAPLAISLTVLAACSPAADGTDTTSPDTAPGVDLVYARTSRGVTDLNPTSDTLATNNAYTLDKIFEPLVELQPDGTITPLLAEQATPSEDGLTWTFVLRDDVTFSDGSALDAADVVFSIERHLDAGGALPLAAPVTDVSAADESTVVLTLSEPYAPLLAELATFANVVLPEDLAGLSEEEFFADPVGTGPFTVGEWDLTTGEITLEANPAYWQGAPSVASVTFTVVDDDNQLLQQLQAGQVDIIEGVPAANVATLEADDGVAVLAVTSWQQGLLALNTVDGPFADVHLRRAAASTLDRPAIAEATTFGTAEPATTFLPPSIQFSDPDIPVYGYDLEVAATELAQSATPDGAEAVLIVESGQSSHVQQAQAIQAALEQIDVTVTIEQLDSTTFWARFTGGDYDLAVTWAISDTGDPSNLTSWQLLPDVANSYNTGFRDEEIIELAAQGVASTDEDERAEIYRDIQERQAQGVPTIPLTYIPTIVGTSAALDGLVVLPNGTTRLHEVTLP